MQILKEEKRQLILKAAEKIFKKNGFRGASITEIATAANLKKNNVFNYFKTKNDLFSAIVGETYTIVKKAIATFAFESTTMNTITELFEYSNSINQLDVYVNFVDTHREEIYLLLFRSEGSSYEHASEEIVSMYVKSHKTVYDRVQNNDAANKNTISAFVLHNLGHFYLSITGEFVKHNIPKEEIEKYSKEILSLIEPGLEETLGCN